MTNLDFHHKKLLFFNNKSYYGKAKRLPVNPALYDGGRRFEFQKILEFSEFKKQARIIELGAGYGKYVIPLLFMGYRVTAVDIGRHLLDAIKVKAKEHHLLGNLRTLQSDFRNKSIPKTYDAAICISTYHLLAETEEGRFHIFSNLVKSVKIGGSVIIIDPNPLNPFLYLLYLFTPQASWELERHFLKSTVGNLKRIFMKAGLSDITIEYVGFLPLRYINIPGVAMLNRIVNKTPFLQLFSSFIYIKGKKG